LIADHDLGLRRTDGVPPTGLIPLRTSQPHRHIQQGLRPLGEVFGDDGAAAAMIGGLVHHAEVIALKGDSYPAKGGSISAGVDDCEVGLAVPK
jgi:hypothetical protein